MFSKGSLSSISLATVTPSTETIGAPHFFSRSTARPRGPRVTFTARASCFTPRRIASRASWSNAILLAAMASPFSGLSVNDREDFVFGQNKVLLAVELHFRAGVSVEEHPVVLLHADGHDLAVLEGPARPHGDDRSPLGLLLGVVRKDDPSRRGLFRLAPFHHHPVVQGPDRFHG